MSDRPQWMKDAATETGVDTEILAYHYKAEDTRVQELERVVASPFKWLAGQVRNGRRFPAAASIEGIAEWLESVSASSAGGE